MFPDTLRRTEIELEVTKAAEGRLLTQLADAREEVRRYLCDDLLSRFLSHTLSTHPLHPLCLQVRRQASLTESMRRIESGLTTRVEEEKATLMQDRDTLSKALEGLRKQAADRSLVDDERVRALEDDLREVRARADEKTLQASTAREELVRLTDGLTDGQLFD